MKPRLQHIVTITTLLLSCETFAAKTTQPIYVHAFDYGAGGTNLCLASHEAALFSNPAMMPFGNELLRWVGIKNVFHAAPEALSFASGKESAEGNALIEQALASPVHLGIETLFSIITNNLGLSLMTSGTGDIEANRYGEFGLPELRVRTDIYTGAMFGAGFEVKRWLSFGLGIKALNVSEIDRRTSISDAASAEDASDFSNLSLTELNTYGYDIGAMIFLQGRYVDYRLSLKADDINGTYNADRQEVFRPTYHAGMSMTLHTLSDMIHMELNYRDISDAYQQPLYKKVYVGAKLTIENFIGLSAGLHHGWPSFGMAFDVILLNFGAAYYVRELGDAPGDDSRQIVRFYVNVGI